MTKREEVAKKLAEQLGCQIVYGTLWRGRTEFDTVTIPRHIVDALISREMRVRDLEDKNSELKKILAPFRKAVDHTMRAGLNSKGEKG